MNPINMRLQIHMEHKPEFLGTHIWLHGEDAQGKFVVSPIPLTIQRITGGEYSEPTLVFTGTYGTQFLSSFANALIEFGIQPDGLKLKENELTAVKYHLEDMRQIAKRHKIL